MVSTRLFAQGQETLEQKNPPTTAAPGLVVESATSPTEQNRRIIGVSARMK